MEAVESVLIVIKECHVFRIPPRTTTTGYRASDWDVNNFMWKGRVRVVEKGGKCTIRLEDPTTGELFAECPYRPDDNSVEQVIDSSRYFVIRLQDPSGQKAFVGMGFPERSDAFDFQVALQDFVKHVKQQKKMDTTSTAPYKSANDYTLKEGQTININIGGKGSGSSSRPRPAENVGIESISALLPPPPSGRNPASATTTNTSAPLIPPPSTSSTAESATFDPFSNLTSNSNTNKNVDPFATTNTSTTNTTNNNNNNSGFSGFQDFSAPSGWTTF